MKISVFTIADYVSEQNGKLIIVGSFDNSSLNPLNPLLKFLFVLP